MRWAPITCGLAALAACHTLPDLGTCGNGIVEQGNGEACDDGRETSTCTATCELKCLSSADGTSYVNVSVDTTAAIYCPDASYRCGTDSICRAPSGKFEPLATSLPFEITGAPSISDVDLDGVSDLVGTSMTNLYVRFGSTSDTPLGEVTIQQAPFSDAPYAIFDLPTMVSGVKQLDTMIAIPTEGVALLRSDGERFTPELDLQTLQNLPITGELLGLAVRDPDPTIGDVPIVVQKTSDTSSIAVVRPPAGLPPIPVQVLLPCVGTGGQPWHTVDVKAAPDRQSFVVITQRDSPTQPAAQPWHVCRYTQSGTGWAIAQFDLAPPTPSSFVLANVDGDSCLELIVHSDGAPGLSMIDATGPTCGFVPAVTPLPVAGLGAAVLSAGQIVPGGLDELVLADGVYRSCTSPADCGTSTVGTFVPIIGPTPPAEWSAATVVDLNADGMLDVVAGRTRMATAGTAAAAEADVDVVRGGAVPNVYRANTAEPVTSLVPGDFDGDRIDDVAMIESTPPGDRVTVLFGTHEGTVGTPVAMSPFSGKLRIDRLSEIHWLPSARGNDGVDDLLVVNTGGMTSPPGAPGAAAGPAAPAAAGLLIGDAARLMTTPRFPTMRTTTGGPQPLGAVAAGTFGSANTEILAITGTQVQLYNVMANDWAPPLDVNMALNQPVGALRDGPSRTRGAARGTGNQVVVFSMRGAFSMCQVTASGTPRELRGIDIDGDGVDELAVFSDDASGNRSLQLFRTTGCPLESLLVNELDGCVDVANAGNRLVAICRSNGEPVARRLVTISSVNDAFVRNDTQFQSQPIDGDARFVTAGDFNGDGVLDIAVGVHRLSTVGVQLLRQCPAHDIRGCK